jgi:hypothetical protein
MNENSLLGVTLKNLVIYREFQKCGFDYIVNPDTGELHKVESGALIGSHNLHVADLENFIGIANLNSIPIHLHFDGTEIPIFDLMTGELLGSYPLNKCKFCYPHLR